MKPLYYVDFIIPTFEDTDINVTHVANRLINVLHGVFKTKPGAYCLAFPQLLPDKPGYFGNKFRVFAEFEEALALLVVNVQKHFVIRDYVNIANILRVPENYRGKWLEYRRFRIPNRNQKRGWDKDQSIRNNRISEKEELKLPYFIVNSDSNGHRFSLFVKAVWSKEGMESPADSYGLSRATQQIAVPIL